MISKGKILWVDDEIELLRPHILFLKEKGYDVETATNGEDAIELVTNKKFDLVFLDEMMAGMGGLRTLSEIKNTRPQLPVIMVTKSEDEGLMENAIGGKISDYLTKPVNPSQILLACKKFLEGKKIESEYVSRDYLKEFNEISTSLFSNPEHDDWVNIYSKLVGWSMDFDAHPELGLKDTLLDQYRTANQEFSNFIEKPESEFFGKSYEFTGIKKDGTEFPIDICLAVIEIENKKNIVATVRKRAEPGLRPGFSRKSPGSSRTSPPLPPR